MKLGMGPSLPSSVHGLPNSFLLFVITSVTKVATVILSEVMPGFSAPLLFSLLSCCPLPAELPPVKVQLGLWNKVGGMDQGGFKNGPPAMCMSACVHS
jgi:hypothetical protein